MLDVERDWNEFPKFRHNLWTTFADNPDLTYLTVSHGKFEVLTSDAREFLKIRGFCTGHNSVDQIAEKSGFSSAKVRDIVDSLAAGDMLRRKARPFRDLDPLEVQGMLLAAAVMWAEQLRETHIAVEVFSGDVSHRVAIGWLLETYHYIKAFPSAIDIAAGAASGELRSVVEEYANQERGHEQFVEDTLVRLGLTRDEVRTSTPLVTTRLIDLLMKEMFVTTPQAALLVAAIVEADDFEEDELPSLSRQFTQHYGVDQDALDPLFRHSMIDAELGHGELAERYRHLLTFSNEHELNDMVNKLHDLKHAFDAQKLEIKEYYSREGNYLPRQVVDYFAI